MQVNAQTGAGNNFAAVFNGGNVGIGTTLPASKLNVVLSPMLTPNYGTVSIGNGAWDGGSAGFFSGSTSGNSLAINEDSSFLGDLANFQTAGVPKLSIDYQGNLESHGDLYSKGLYWTTRQTFGAGLQYKSVAFGNGLFVGVADGGTTANDVVTSPDGINWTTHTITNAVTWTGVTYGNGMFVAVAQDGTTAQQIMSSPDGINWTPQTSPVANKWVSVTYGNGTFVAVASNGTVADQVMTSVDGVTWNAQTIANTETWADVTYGNGLFVAIASTGGGTKSIMTSPDGITWTWRASQDPAIDGNLPAAITYGNGLFVVVYNYAGGSKVQTSPDGINWTYRNSVGASGIQHIGYGNGLFVGFSDNSVGISMVSRDGITWTTDMQNVSGFFHYDIAYGNGMFVSFDNKNAVQTSGYNDYQTVQNNNKFNGGMTITGLTANAGYSSVCISTTGVLTFASTTCNNPSALRFKTDVETLTGNLDKVTALRPVGYTSLVDKGHYVGFIAEEVAPIEKRLVNFNENGEAIGLNYAQFAPLLAGAIQEVNIKVKNLSSIDVNQDGSLASLITRFLGDAVVSIKEATISTLHIGEKVCVDDVCVTKEQFKQILINGGASGATSTPATTDATPPATDTTPESVPPATIDASTTPPPADVVTPDAPPSDPATPPVEIP
jgi:hypothetical protein